MNGYYLMHRGWLLNPALDEREYCRKAAWAYLIDQASHRKRGRLDRGQLAASHKQLATEWGWTKSRVERFLKTLQQEGMIQIETRGRKPSILTLCNYDKYQAPKPAEPRSDEAHLARLSRHERDQSGTPYNQLNQNENNTYTANTRDEMDRQLLEELFCILFGLVDKSAAHTSLRDITEPKRWRSQYDWDGLVIPTIKQWAERNRKKSTPTIIQSWSYFTQMLENAFERERIRML